MSIAHVLENINRKKDILILGLFMLSAGLGFLSFLGIGLLWQRINEPAPIVFQCEEEVLRGLRATSSPPIPKVGKGARK